MIKANQDNLEKKRKKKRVWGMKIGDDIELKLEAAMNSGRRGHGAESESRSPAVGEGKKVAEG